MANDIAVWLDRHGLGQYAAVFAENGVDLESLALLTEQDLKELGLLLGHRRRLRKALDDARDGDVGDAPHEAPAQAPPAAHPGTVVQQVERRQLTVMFCDLVDSTALSTRLDPEDLREVIRAYQHATCEVITRYDGHVAQYLGDGILAYFGYPHAHEDDAVRAVHAGLAILDLLPAISDQLLARTRTPLAVRIGIHSGVVAVGRENSEGAGERLAIGETPNIAARLQAYADAGTIAISEITQRLLGGRFESVDLGAVPIKGAAVPIRALRVTGISTSPTRFDAAARDGLTPLVGRAQEIGLLTDRWQLAQEGEGQVVLISGEAGLGKSRLLRELMASLGANPVPVLRFQCSPYHTNSAYYPLMDHMERALQLATLTTPTDKLDALESLVIARLGLSRQHAQLLAQMLSLPIGDRYPPLTSTPQRQKEDTLGALVDLTLAVARSERTLLVFEDVHWADPTTLEFLDLLVDRAVTARLLLLLTHRPDFVPRWTAHGHVTALALSRLSRAQSTAIIARLAGGKALPPGLSDQIVEKTDGVPLFVEELTRSLLESDQLRDLGDHYAVATTGSGLQVPATLRDSLMARLDRDSWMKEVAQIASTIGREFPYSLLRAVAGGDDPTLQVGLDRLVDSGLAFRRGTPPDATYTFKHALVQGAAYDLLAKGRRQALHAALATAIEREMPSVADTEPELLAHHYSAAGMPAQAIPRWRQAADIALGRVAPAEAIAHLSRGLELLADLPDGAERDTWEIELRILLGAAWIMRSGWHSREVWSAVQPALALARALRRDDMLGGIYYAIYANVCVQGRVEDAARWSQEALSTAAQSSDGSLRTVAELLGLFWRMGTGDWHGAAAHAANLTRAYATADHGYTRRAINMDPADNADTYAGIWTWALGFPDRARTLHRAHLAKARASNHPFMIPYGLTVSALVYDLRGEPEVLAEYAREAIQFGRDNALPVYADLFGPMFLALAESRSGTDPAANERLREAIRAWQRAEAGFLLPYMQAGLADALARSGDCADALEVVEESLARIERPGWGERWWLVENLRVKGVVLARLGRAAEAEAVLAQALAVAREQRAKSWELRAATALAQLWRDQRRRADVRTLLAPIYESFGEGFETRDLVEARRLISESEPVPSKSPAQA